MMVKVDTNTLFAKLRESCVFGAHFSSDNDYYSRRVGVRKRLKNKVVLSIADQRISKINTRYLLVIYQPM